MEIIDYDKKYKDAIDEIQKAQWGEGSDTDELLDNLENYFIKIAIENEELIGVIAAHLENEMCFIDFILIKPKWQKHGIGTKLMTYVIDFAKENNCKSIDCEAINVYGKINSKKLLENFGFVQMREHKNYWGKKCPDFYCTECNSKPCVCSMDEYKKIL